MLTEVPEKKRNILHSRSCCIILQADRRLKGAGKEKKEE